MQEHSCVISTGVSQILRTYQDSLSRQQREPGLDADTKDLATEPSPSSELAELAFKGTTGPRL